MCRPPPVTTGLPGFAEPGAHHGVRQLHTVDLNVGEKSVVFLHGLGGTARYWQSTPVQPVFAGASTRLVDLYGFGASPRPWCRYTLDRHLEALRRTLVGPRPQVLVGHSLGAALALAFAARHPTCVKGLVLMGLPQFGSPEDAATWFRQQPGGWIYTNLLATMLACVVTRRVARGLLPHLVRDVPRVVAQDLVLHNAMSSATSLWNVIYRHDSAADAAALPIGLPVLCIHGRDDRTAPLRRIRALHRHRPDWALLELDADHHPWLRQPRACHAAIGELLNQVNPSASVDITGAIAPSARG